MFQAIASGSLEDLVSSPFRRVGERFWLFLFLCCLISFSVTVASAQALTNPERHYEMVSPLFKAGFGASHIEAVAENGESVVFFSPGAFAGAPAGFSGGLINSYLARRSGSQWSTTPLMPPATKFPFTP